MFVNADAPKIVILWDLIKVSLCHLPLKKCIRQSEIDEMSRIIGIELIENLEVIDVGLMCFRA